MDYNGIEKTEKLKNTISLPNSKTIASGDI